LRAVLDTSVLIGGSAPTAIEAAISVATLAELHFGVSIASDPDERSRRMQRLGAVEATFDPLPVTAAVAREWGRLAAAVVERGGQPRRRATDLVIAATASVHQVVLITEDLDDLKIIRDLVDVRSPHELPDA
jgi:hypothetical protein